MEITTDPMQITQYRQHSEVHRRSLPSQMELSSVNNTANSTVPLRFSVQRRAQRVVFPLNCWSSKNLRFLLFRKPQARRLSLSRYLQWRALTPAQRGPDGPQHPGPQSRGNLQSLHLRFGRRHLLLLLPRGGQRAALGAIGEHRVGHVVRKRLRNVLRSVQERRAEPSRAAALRQRGQPSDSRPGNGLAHSMTHSRR